MNTYNIETSRGPTHCFTVIPYDVQDETYNIKTKIEKVEVDVETKKNQLKSMVHEINKSPLEREKLLIWQQFVADPDSLKYRFKELEKLRGHY